ncbi:hypothetical protein FJQ98_16245 [Lysinibacillus agricola]|uniref:Uncharacterized protein n=1 Tax=Lysinibacillus agricola TaxID=2590012 RepID=A0ABX7AMS4_9BACI|nr:MULTISPECIES: hypothetical protein [Lysinibacillus]KOS61512.1 hypothetical protein AN161_18150 [Lysinibacillus sp. FJAT-14222]QQP10796.1 hypothetical protein FJQ98_16245 [Lysinibacillus agricola]
MKNGKNFFEYYVYVDKRSGSKENNCFTIFSSDILNENDIIVNNNEYFKITEVYEDNLTVESITVNAVNVYKVI